MSVLIVLAALAALMLLAYRGYSVILFAPAVALAAAVLTLGPTSALPVYSGVFMTRLAGFVQLYFPVFLLGAVFGKLIEVSGFARTIVRALVSVTGPDKAILSVVLICAVLTYGGVSLFVVVFAVYPFAAELFRAADIPKRLMPATVVLGAFTFTMDALPGTPQIQNVIPTTFFQTDAWAAPWLGLIGGTFVFVSGLLYLEWRRRAMQRAGEGYGEAHVNEPVTPPDEGGGRLAVALVPLLLVGVLNLVFTSLIPDVYGQSFDLQGIGVANASPIAVDSVKAIWALELALVAAILAVLLLSYPRVRPVFNTAVATAVAGALLVTFNTGSEYGFGAVIAVLEGFRQVNAFLSQAIGNTLLNVAVTTNILAGITGSASGGMSIALASMGETYLASARAAGISPEVLHRVAAMASGGMDTLPHNGAVITLLAVTGLTHRQSYADIFAMTLIKVAAVFVIIAAYYLFGVH